MPKNQFSQFMNEEDYDYCSSQFGMDMNQVRGMKDVEWFDFFDCTPEDLPYYLFGDARMNELSEDAEFMALLDGFAENFEYEDDFSINERFDDLIETFGSTVEEEQDLWTSTFSKYSPPTPLRKALATKPRGRNKLGTGLTAKAKKPVPHYFVIIK